MYAERYRSNQSTERRVICMEVFLQWGIMLLGILGVVQLGELLSIWLRRPKKRPTSFCVMPLHGSIGNVEQVLTYFQEVALWSPEVQLAFVIDCGLEEHSALACKEWCNQKNRLIFCTQKEFEDICKGFQDRVY